MAASTWCGNCGKFLYSSTWIYPTIKCDTKHEWRAPLLLSLISKQFLPPHPILSYIDCQIGYRGSAQRFFWTQGLINFVICLWNCLAVRLLREQTRQPLFPPKPARLTAFCIYRIHFYLQHERNYCLSAPAAASAEQLSNELSPRLATPTLHTENQVGIVLGDRFSLQLGTQSHRWYLLKIFQIWNWSQPQFPPPPPHHTPHCPRFAIFLWFDFHFGHLINSKMRTSVYIAHIGSKEGGDYVLWSPSACNIYSWVYQIIKLP